MTAPRLTAGAARPPAGQYDADIVILALDRPDETAAAIHSALAQRGVSRHVTIVDQGSRPESLARLATAVNGRSDATLLALDTNLGVPGGRNIASAFGHGRILVALDNDAVFDTDGTVARMVAALDANRTLAALGCRILVDSTGQDDLTSWGYPASLLPHAGDSFDTATFVGAGHAIRRQAWAEAGGYDASLFFCWEEYDFCLRAIARGWTIRYRGDIVVRHKVSPDRRVAWSGGRWFHFVRNRLVIERKHGASWLSLTPRIAGYAVKAARNGCLGTTPRAIRAARAMARTIEPEPLSAAARAYLWRADTAHRGGPLSRLRREVLAALPGQRTVASIRAISSGGSGPASAAATHSASS